MKLRKLERPVAVEELVVRVRPGTEERWVQTDAAVWSPRLEACAGFLGKEIWLNRDVPGEITVLIYWADYAAWQGMDRTWVAALEEEMAAAFGRRDLEALTFRHSGSQKFKVYEYK